MACAMPAAHPLREWSACVAKTRDQRHARMAAPPITAAGCFTRRARFCHLIDRSRYGSMVMRCCAITHANIRAIHPVFSRRRPETYPHPVQGPLLSLVRGVGDGPLLRSRPLLRGSAGGTASYRSFPVKACDEARMLQWLTMPTRQSPQPPGSGHPRAGSQPYRLITTIAPTSPAASTRADCAPGPDRAYPRPPMPGDASPRAGPGPPAITA